MQINKSDRNDAAGIARIMRTGWYREVQAKSPDSHATRALLNSRALLVRIQRDVENQVRDLLKISRLIGTTVLRRSPGGPGGPRGSPTGCSAGSGTTPRSGETGPSAGRPQRPP